MPSRCSTSDDPPSQLARALAVRASPFTCSTVHRQDARARAALAAWLEAIPILERRPLCAPTRLRLADSGRICGELARVLDGEEAGEGRASERTLHLAVARGRIHAMSSMFACPAGTFIELLVTAPWNLLTAGDPADPRTMRGAGTALVAAAGEWSHRRGCGGSVALQAASSRVVPFYERLGFREMGPADDPLALVPKGEDGWSASIQRVARGRPGAEERRSPWLLFPARRATVAAVTAAAMTAAG